MMKIYLMFGLVVLLQLTVTRGLTLTKAVHDTQELAEAPENLHVRDPVLHSNIEDIILESTRYVDEEVERQIKAYINGEENSPEEDPVDGVENYRIKKEMFVNVEGHNVYGNNVGNGEVTNHYIYNYSHKNSNENNGDDGENETGVDYEEEDNEEVKEEDNKEEGEDNKEVEDEDDRKEEVEERDDHEDW